MRFSLKGCVLALAAALVAFGAQAQTIKVGVIGPFSGPFAGSFGTPFKQGIEAYLVQHGKQVAGQTVEFVYRDLVAPDPQRARALAQELIVNEKVQYLAGFVFTPNALAVAPLVTEAKIPTIIFNASTSIVVSRSEFFVRTSNTLPQVSVPVAQYAIEKGVKTVVTVVSDYGPGVDAETSFKWAFEKAGGKVVETIRMPLNSTDFTPFLQRIRSIKPDALFAFLPYGPPTYNFVKSYSDNKLKADGIRFLGTGETQESDLQALGDPAIGLETGYFYSAAHESPQNKAFTEALQKVQKGAIPNPATVSAYDGVHVIYKMIEATNGKLDGEKAIAAVKGLKWESPRGPMLIDAKTRDVVQNLYMRRVERNAQGVLINKEFQTFPNQPDYGLQMPKPN